MKKVLATLLALAMMVGILPAFAEGKITEEPITLHFMAKVQTYSQDYDELPFFKALEEKTGINIEWTLVRSGWDEKKAMVIAGGDLPDAFFGDGLLDSDISSNSDMFVPLEEYIQEYCPNITNVFESLPITRQMSVFPDGHIYSLPQVMPLRPSCNDTLMINKTWLDKLGLQVPTTIQEFYDVCVAFKEQDPNGNGVADEIPFNFANFDDSRWFTARDLIGAWGVMYDMTFNYLTCKDGKVSYMPAMNEYKELVKFLGNMYAAGLVNQTVFTDDLGTYASLGCSPDVPILGCSIGWNTGIFGEWGDQYIAIPPFRASEDVAPLWGTNRSLVKYDINHFVVTTANEHIVETMKWIDECYSSLNSLYLYYGYEGVGIQTNDDGTFTVLASGDPSMDQDTWKWYNATSDFGPLAVLPDMEAKLIDESGYYSDRVAMGEIYTPYLLDDKDIYPLAKFEKDVQEELTLLKTDISSYVDRMFAKWITTGGCETEWDSYINELNNMGLERMVQIYQQGYDRYYAE